MYIQTWLNNFLFQTYNSLIYNIGGMKVFHGDPFTNKD